MIKDFGLPWIAHVVLLIVLPVIWGAIIRITRGKLLLGILYFFTGGYFLIGWIIDIVQLILKKNFALKY
ncbi:MAG: TM2 domain-containing protein [Bacilli bacterium]|jgi:hypothetical protein|nr:TM2 domain-containing protein [Bacilli bacterium]NLN80097.1 TM2 domain-containing protein [Erysipelotrichia bacterium]